MKLLLDIGNTRIKWAYAVDGALSAGGEVVHRDRLPNALAEMTAALADTPESVVAVNVAGRETGAQIAAAVQAFCGCQPRFLPVGERCGEVTNGYARFDQLGIDRWAAVIGAWHRLRTDVCVVDAGTALTIDLLLANGSHLGGIILPGLRMMEDTLGGATADIAAFAAGAAGPDEAAWYGRSTAEAVQRGARFSLCAAIDRAVDQFPTGALPLVLLTGGDAAQLQAALRRRSELCPQLVLEGLLHLEQEAS